MSSDLNFRLELQTSNLKTLPEQLAVREGAHLNTISNLKTLPEQLAVGEGAHLNTLSNLKILPEQVAVCGRFTPFYTIFLSLDMSTRHSQR